MNNRRDFLLKGSLATAAMLVLKPMQSVAADIPGFDKLVNHSNKLVLLHTPYLHPEDDYRVMQQIATIRARDAQAILLRASSNTSSQEGQLQYDAAIADGDTDREGSDYKIVQKGNIRSGIISVRSGEDNVIEKANRLAAYLKKEKKCTMVVCLSQLGYACKQAPDDQMLASQSSHIDIIIGGHPENFHRLPVIMLNKDQAEVIIHAAGDNSFGYGKVAIDFDERGRKRQVSFAV